MVAALWLRVALRMACDTVMPAPFHDKY